MQSISNSAIFPENLPANCIPLFYLSEAPFIMPPNLTYDNLHIHTAANLYPYFFNSGFTIFFFTTRRLILIFLLNELIIFNHEFNSSNYE